MYRAHCAVIFAIAQLSCISNFMIRYFTATFGNIIRQSCVYYQRVSISSYATADIAREGMSVCLSVTLRCCVKTKKASVMISSPSESQSILVSRNIWVITKFERGHPEGGRFMRLGWVKIGNFDDFSTNKPPYLRNAYYA